VGFCIAAGSHGLVFPALGSEVQFLTDEERMGLVEVVVREANGRIPVVAGVSGPSRAVASVHARHAAKVGADAVIALPPYLSPASREEIRDYYEGIAAAAGRPVFLQHTGTGLDADLMRELLERVPNVRYVKEEAQPSAHQISAVLRSAGGACLGVFGGAHGRWMLSEMRRGAAGFMPAVEAVDVHVQVWEAYQRGDEAGARRIYDRLLPLINLITLLGLKVCKRVLVKRGVFETTAMRQTGVIEPDAEDEEELEAILEGLRPLFRL
jgi:4-hydroxy-tetrahydrodipicolinate synthase